MPSERIRDLLALLADEPDDALLRVTLGQEYLTAGDPATALRLRIATSRLYGEATWQQEAALTADDPVALPWIADALDWLRQALTTVTA